MSLCQVSHSENRIFTLKLISFQSVDLSPSFRNEQELLIPHGEAWRKESYKGFWSILFLNWGRWQGRQHSFTQRGWQRDSLALKDWVSGSFYCWDTERISVGHFPCPCRSSCEGLWASHYSPSPWREGAWLWLCSSTWFTASSCSGLVSAEHSRQHSKSTAPNHQTIYLPSQRPYLIMQISPPLQSSLQVMAGANP